MQYFALTTLIAAAAASPVLLDRNPFPYTTLVEDCEAAPNCETYIENGRTLVRFKPGTEPGSSYYNNTITKRDDPVIYTKIQFGDTSINYGDVGASQVKGIIHHLYDVCHETGCDHNDYIVKTNIVDKSFGSVPFAPQELAIKAQGVYSSWDERNAFVEILVAAAAQGEDCKDETWVNPGNPPYSYATPGGPAKQCKQTNFFQATRYHKVNGDPVIAGYMSALVQFKEESGWCGKIAGVLSGYASAIGAYPPLSGLSSIASGSFGVLSALCQ